MTMKRVLEKLDKIQEDIVEIKVQTTKTNGRLTNVEDKQKLLWKVITGVLIVIIAGSIMMRFTS